MTRGRASAATGAAASLLRAVLWATLLWVFAADWEAAQVRDALRTLPELDHAAQAEALIAQRRFDEAELVIAAGLQEASPQRRWALERLREELDARREDPRYRLAELARGALTGQADSAEALTGAVIADLLVFGDVRDLLVQGSRAAAGEPADPVIVGLSAAGILLTATPSLDLGAALLKTARRVGALGERFAATLLRMCRRALRRGDASELERLLSDVSRLQAVAGTRPTLKILARADHPADIARAARFATTPAAAHALYVGGDAALEWLRVSGKAGERWLLAAARRGSDGVALLARSGRVLLRPHPLLGLLKGVYKGTVPAWLAHWLERWSSALLGVLAAALLVELAVLTTRLRRLRALLAQDSPGASARIDRA